MVDNVEAVATIQLQRRLIFRARFFDHKNGTVACHEAGKYIEQEPQRLQGTSLITATFALKFLQIVKLTAKGKINAQSLIHGDAEGFCSESPKSNSLGGC